MTPAVSTCPCFKTELLTGCTMACPDFCLDEEENQAPNSHHSAFWNCHIQPQAQPCHVPFAQLARVSIKGH